MAILSAHSVQPGTDILAILGVPSFHLGWDKNAYIYALDLLVLASQMNTHVPQGVCKGWGMFN